MQRSGDSPSPTREGDHAPTNWYNPGTVPTNNTNYTNNTEQGHGNGSNLDSGATFGRSDASSDGGVATEENRTDLDGFMAAAEPSPLLPAQEAQRAAAAAAVAAAAAPAGVLETPRSPSHDHNLQQATEVPESPHTPGPLPLQDVPPPVPFALDNDPQTPPQDRLQDPFREGEAETSPQNPLPPRPSAHMVEDETPPPRPRPVRTPARWQVRRRRAEDEVDRHRVAGGMNPVWRFGPDSPVQDDPVVPTANERAGLSSPRTTAAPLFPEVPVGGDAARVVDEYLHGLRTDIYQTRPFPLPNFLYDAPPPFLPPDVDPVVPRAPQPLMPPGGLMPMSGLTMDGPRQADPRTMLAPPFVPIPRPFDDSEDDDENEDDTEDDEEDELPPRQRRRLAAPEPEPVLGAGPSRPRLPRTAGMEPPQHDRDVLGELLRLQNNVLRLENERLRCRVEPAMHTMRYDEIMRRGANIPSRRDFMSRYRAIDEADECTICLESFKDKDVVILPCAHKFCRECLAEWFQQKGRRTCPNCRRVLFTEDDSKAPFPLREPVTTAALADWQEAETDVPPAAPAAATPGPAQIPPSAVMEALPAQPHHRRPLPPGGIDAPAMLPFRLAHNHRRPLSPGFSERPHRAQIEPTILGPAPGMATSQHGTPEPAQAHAEEDVSLREDASDRQPSRSHDHNSDPGRDEDGDREDV